MSHSVYSIQIHALYVEGFILFRNKIMCTFSSMARREIRRHVINVCVADGFVSDFDPWDESVKALADMIEKNKVLDKVAKNTQNGLVNNLTGFDPWDESSKALADLIEKEGAMSSFPGMPPRSNPAPPPGLANHMPPPAAHHPLLATKNLPPGLTPNHIGAFNTSMPPPPSGMNSNSSQCQNSFPSR